MDGVLYLIYGSGTYESDGIDIMEIDDLAKKSI